MKHQSQTGSGQGWQSYPTLRRVYWETTARCNLRCIHCRRIDVLNREDPNELSTKEAKKLIDDLASMGRPVLILSGGEPLFRRDIFEIASYGTDSGLPVALSTNGTLVSERMVQSVRDAGIYYASISLDGASRETHEKFRGDKNFFRALRGLKFLKDAGIKVQVNFTVTRSNVKELPAMVELCRYNKADALYLFLLVPVGCGVQIADSQMLSSKEVEEWLKWTAKISRNGSMEIRAICAPQYYRVEHELQKEKDGSAPLKENRSGCLAGSSICFISHKGDVFPCGYLPLSAGNVRENSLPEIWKKSNLFSKLRNHGELVGKCGRCNYKMVCGGCRARAFYQYNDIMAEEPFCEFQPVASVPNLS